MNERGQVFSLDMFLALTLTALIVSYSGVAFDMARRQSEDYVSRHSLERITNDVADILIKMSGSPENWERNAVNLVELGLTEENEGNPLQYTISITKFGQFRMLTNADNWTATPNENAVKAIRNLFGGSEKFQVRVLDENKAELWHAFPNWSSGQVGENSGMENSTEVAVARRLVAIRYGTVFKADSGPLLKTEGGVWDNENLEFEIYPGELDAFDFYIVVVERAPVGGNPNLKIYINRDTTADPDYTFVNETIDIFPNPTEPNGFEHGGIENDAAVDNQLVEGFNYFSFKRTSNPNWTVQIYLVMLPACSDWSEAATFLEPLPGSLEVMMWR